MHVYTIWVMHGHEMLLGSVVDKIVVKSLTNRLTAFQFSVFLLIFLPGKNGFFGKQAL